MLLAVYVYTGAVICCPQGRNRVLYYYVYLSHLRLSPYLPGPNHPKPEMSPPRTPKCCTVTPQIVSCRPLVLSPPPPTLPPICYAT